MKDNIDNQNLNLSFNGEKASTMKTKEGGNNSKALLNISGLTPKISSNASSMNHCSCLHYFNDLIIDLYLSEIHLFLQY